MPRRFCRDCDRHVLAVRNGIPFLVNLGLALLTCGLWLPVMFVVEVGIGVFKPHLCPVCGRGV